MRESFHFRTSETERNVSAITDHTISLKRVIDWDCANRKRQNGPSEAQRSDTHQERTRQVDALNCIVLYCIVLTARGKVSLE